MIFLHGSVLTFEFNNIFDSKLLSNLEPQNFQRTFLNKYKNKGKE
jgi:hypothetical protein